LVAFGQTFVILIGGFDLSVGAVMGLTSTAAGLLMVKGMASPFMAVLIALLLALLCGLINGYVTNYIGLNPFVSTFGMWGMALGVALIITEERVVVGFPPTLRVFHDGSLAGIPLPLIIVLAIGGVLHLFLKATPYGTATYALGGNEAAASLSGIPVRFQKTMTYSFCGFMSGMAGLMFLARANSAQAVDPIGYEFDSIVAVVVGGTSLTGGKGGVFQTLIGVALLATVRNGLNLMGVNQYLQLVLVGMILISAYLAEGQTSRLASLKERLKSVGRTGFKKG
jgi:ribose/xylose/arabinose/galactoside ABC-type transport system permease subunit